MKKFTNSQNVSMAEMRVLHAVQIYSPSSRDVQVRRPVRKVLVVQLGIHAFMELILELEDILASVPRGILTVCQVKEKFVVHTPVGKKGLRVCVSLLAFCSRTTGQGLPTVPHAPRVHNGGQ